MIAKHQRGTFKLNTASGNRDEAYSPVKVDVFKKQFNRFLSKSRTSKTHDDTNPQLTPKHDESPRVYQPSQHQDFT